MLWKHMVRHALAGLVTAMVGSALQAQTAAPLPDGGGIPPDIAAVLRQRGPVIDPPGMKALYAPLLAAQPSGSAACHCDLAYGDDPRHRLDVHVPAATGAGATGASAQERRPVLVFFHGGGFVRGDKSERLNLAQAFVREGFVVVLPNYRLGPTHRWPAGAQDVAMVMQWTAAHIAAHGGDPRRVVLAGESAGAAHVAASMLVRRLGPPAAAAPAAVVLISGVYNARLEALARPQFGIATPDTRNEAYFGQDLAAWSGMSTVDLVDAAPFPLLITYAEIDPPQMQVQAGELFARLVSRHGFQPALHVVRGHNHISQLSAIGTGDTTLTQPLLVWMRAALAAAR